MPAPTFTNEIEVMVCAGKRSGHHGVILDLLGTSPRFCFINNVGKRRVYRPGLIRRAPDLRLYNNMGLDVDAELEGRPAPKHLLLYNLESEPVATARALFDRAKTKRSIGASARRHFVVLVRDPLNHFASLYQRAHKRRMAGSDTAHQRLLDFWPLWQDHWDAATQGADVIGVEFNRWLNDDDYRVQLFARLGLTAGARPAATAPWGGGSSFADTGTHTAAPSAHALETRVLRFMNDPDFRAFLRLPEARTAVEHYLNARPNTHLQQAWHQLRA